MCVKVIRRVRKKIIYKEERVSVCVCVCVCERERESDYGSVFQYCTVFDTTHQRDALNSLDYFFAAFSSLEIFIDFRR